MSRLPSICSALLALGLLFPAAVRADDTAALRSQSPITVEEAYRLGTGDKVRIIVFGEDDLGGEFQVDGNGRISLPLIGEVLAAGQTAPDLERRLAGRLANGYLHDPKVSVEITTYRPFYVIGEVNKPGEFAYVNGMSALNAVALAGGYSERASESTIYIRRNGSTVEEKAPADQMTRIWPGDVVRVSRTIFWSVMSVVAPVTGLGSMAYSLSRY